MKMNTFYGNWHGRILHCNTQLYLTKILKYHTELYLFCLF